MPPPWLALGLGYLLGMILLAIIVGTYLHWLGKKYPPREPEESDQGSPGSEPGRR